MAKQLKCPNKSLPQWQALVKALGGEEDAYLAFFRNGDDIPSVEKAMDLLGVASSKELEEQVAAKVIQKKFIDQAGSAKRIVRSVKREQKANLKQKLGAAVATQRYLENKGVDPVEAHRRAYSKLRGENAQYEQRYEPIREAVGDDAIKQWREAIVHDEDIQWLDRDKLVDIIDRLADGSYVTTGEAKLFGKYFGPEAEKVATARVPFGDKAWLTLLEVLGIPRTLFASFDVSGLGRQGRMLLQAYPQLTPEAVRKAMATFWSEDTAVRLEEEYQTSRAFEEAKTTGLDLPSWHNVEANIQDFEERFQFAGMIQKIPGVRASERSYVTVLNWLRCTIMDRVVSQTEASRGQEMTLPEKQHLAKVINHLSGRANLPGGRTSITTQAILNALFFSPKFVVSRLAPLVDVPLAAARSVVTFDADSWSPRVRLELQPELMLQFRSWASLMGTGLLVALIAKMGWGDEADVELDARSTEFGKLKIGSMRMDLTPGYVTAARFLARLASGEVKTSSGEIREQSPLDTIADFVTSKTAPIPSLVMDLFNGQDRMGRPLLEGPKGEEGKVLDSLGIPPWVQGLNETVFGRIVPGWIQDATDALMVEGVPQMFAMGAISFFGGGAQTYETSGNQKAAIIKNQLAERTFGQRWNDLKPSQQQNLRRQHKEIAEMELQGKRESPPLLKMDRTEQYNAHKRIYATLSKDVQTALNEVGQDVGISRRIGKDFYLNETRYDEYERRAGLNIERGMSRLLSTSFYQRAEPPARKLIVDKVLQKAKLAARTSILIDVERGKL